MVGGIIAKKEVYLTMLARLKNVTKVGARTEGYCPDTNNENATIDNIEGCKNRALEKWNRRANDGKID